MNALAENEAQVEHYVTGRLSPEEEARFEEAYLENPRLAAHVEAAERLHRGLSSVAAEDVVRTSVVARLGWRLGRFHLAAFLGLAVLCLGAFQVGRSWTPPLAPTEPQAQANTPIMHLSALRSSGPGAEPYLLSVSAAPESEGEWIVLTLEAPPPELPRYQVTILDARGGVLWHSAELQPDPEGRLVISLRSALLPPGDAEIRLAAPDASEDLARFPLQIVPIP